MVSPQESQEAYQTALAWVTRHVEEAQRQGLTRDYLGGVAYVSATSEGLGASVARIV
jgi:hypothetical protein